MTGSVSRFICRSDRATNELMTGDHGGPKGSRRPDFLDKGSGLRAACYRPLWILNHIPAASFSDHDSLRLQGLRIFEICPSVYCLSIHRVLNLTIYPSAEKSYVTALAPLTPRRRFPARSFLPISCIQPIRPMPPFLAFFICLTACLAVSADLQSSLQSQGIAATFPGDSGYASASRACEFIVSVRST